MTTCPRCGTRLPADVSVCPTCGAQVGTPPTQPPDPSDPAAANPRTSNPWQSDPAGPAASRDPAQDSPGSAPQDDDTRIQTAATSGDSAPEHPGQSPAQQPGAPRTQQPPQFPGPQSPTPQTSGPQSSGPQPGASGSVGRGNPYDSRLSEPAPTADWIRVGDGAGQPNSQPTGPGVTPPGTPPPTDSRAPEPFPGPGGPGLDGPRSDPFFSPEGFRGPDGPRQDGPAGLSPAVDSSQAGAVRTGPTAAGPPRADPRAFARPAAYPSYLSWLVTAAGRNKLGLLGALITTWFGLPTGVLLGGVGLVVGGIGGFIGGTVGPLAGIDQIPLIGPIISQTPFVGTFLTEITARGGGILGLLLGAFLGALAGFLVGLLGPWVAGFAAGWPTGLALLLAQIPIAALCGLLYTTYSIAAERITFRIRGMRRPSRREQTLLQPILIDCARRLGLDDLPVLLIDDTRETNMYAGARHMIITRGFMDEFNYDPEPIAGVFCHELTHWRNADCVSNYLVRGVALPLYLLYSAVSRLMWLARRTGGIWAGILTFVLILTLWPIEVCVRFVIMPSQRNGSRLMEYQADQGAVAAGMRGGLRRALARFRASFDGARNGWESSVGSTHPPNELRLERIEDHGVDYPLPDPDGPAVPMQVSVTSVLERD